MRRAADRGRDRAGWRGPACAATAVTKGQAVILDTLRAIGARLSGLAAPRPEPTPPVPGPPIRLRRPGVPDPLPADLRRARAERVLAGPAGRYGLGAGGRDPLAALPWGAYQARRGESPARVRERRAAGPVWLDCSGAVSWVLGVPRRIPGYAGGWGYVSTDGLIADAEDPAVELVEYVAPGEPIVPWECLVVYGWADRDGDGVRDGDEIGHVGIVAAVPPGHVYGGPASLEALTVWHCASSPSPTGAVRLSDGRAWRRRGRVVRVV